jgi:hypothetical protein
MEYIKSHEEHTSSIVATIESKSTDLCKKVEFIQNKYTHTFSIGLDCQIDGKYKSELDYYKFAIKPEFPENTIAIRKSSKGYILVDITDLLDVIQKYGNTSKFEVIKKTVDKLIEIKRRKLISLSNKKEVADKETFIRNLSETKHISKILSDAIDGVKDKYLNQFEISIKKRLDFVISLIDKCDDATFDARPRQYSLIKKLEYTILYNGITNRNEKEYRNETYTNNSKYFNSDGSLKNNSAELVKETALTIYETLKENYVYKNAFKLGTIVYAKSNLHLIEQLSINLTYNEFEGRFKVSFNDGSSFVIYSQTVYVEGYIQSEHTRYPTTYHQIMYSTGEKYAKFSEEEMINLFSKNIFKK